MQQLLDLPRLLCRPALPMDTPQVLAFTRRIWEGEDYVPYIWDEWLADPEGLLAVAEYSGQVIGLSKLTRLDADQWWLEGLRVHPEYQGRGVAAHLHDYLLEYWHRRGNGVLRLATSSSRESVKHLALRTGFKPVAEYSYYRTTSRFDQNSSVKFFTKVEHDKFDALYNHLVDSQALPLQFGLINLGWRWAKPTLENLVHVLREEQIWWWRDQQGVVIADEDTEKSRRCFSIRTISCSKDEINFLLNDIRGLAASMGYNEVHWLAPLHPGIPPLLSEAGFVRDWDESLLIFEKLHDK